MRIQVKVEDLRLGMFIDALDGRWLDHPFWRKRFLLENPEDIQALLQSPVNSVWIDTAKGLSPAENDQPIELPEYPPEQQPGSKPVGTAKALEDVRNRVSAEDELVRARKVIDNARPVMKAMFREARLGKALDVEVCLPIVDEINASVSRNASALTSLLRLKSQDEYTYMHSVAVCALMTSLALELGLSALEVRTAALAGLMHDLGKAQMPLSVLNKPGKLTDEEFQIMRTHPQRGADLLGLMDGMPEGVVDVCLHHHEKMDGSGYPRGLKAEEISLLARMGAICDVYDAVTSLRPYKDPWQASDALSRMLTWEGHFDTDMLKKFIRCVGIYPLGSLVRLASGKLGVVIDQNPTQLVKPVVKTFMSASSKLPLPMEKVNLAAMVRGQPVDTIVNRENPADWGISEERLHQLWTGA